MSISSFFKLVEIRTKVASVLPFIFGSLYTLYTFDTFSPYNALIMFCSMLLFDMTTTAINNYIDYKKAILKQGYGFEVHNAMVHYQLNPTLVKIIIFIMLAISTALGLYLVYLTNIVVLFLGMFCFAIGVLYTYGPIPISRTPFGEIFSGVVMGLVLTFISIYIHIFDSNFLLFQLNVDTMLLRLDLKELIKIVCTCMPFVFTIANIMLANNICDIKEDIANKRYTLPIYIGRKKALLLWNLNYYGAYLFILFSILKGYLPWISLACLITFIPVKHNIDYFNLKQSKAETFVYAIQNFLLISSSLIVSLIIGLFINYHVY